MSTGLFFTEKRDTKGKDKVRFRMYHTWKNSQSAHSNYNR